MAKVISRNIFIVGIVAAILVSGLVSGAISAMMASQGPRGDPGATGATGATGPQGPPGPQGPYLPDYDSGWVNTGGKVGQYFNITHSLNYGDILVDVVGRADPSGSVHQKYLGLSGYMSGWSKTYGGTNTDFGYSLVQTADGGYAIAGDTASFGSFGGNVYLVRTDATGNTLWSKTYGGTNADRGASVVQTSDGGYAIAGDTTSFGAGSYDVYLVKTDASGNMMWNKTYGGTGIDRAYSLVQTSDGGYAIAGWTTSFGDKVYLVKTDASGNMVWNKTYGGPVYDFGYSLVESSDGGYAIAGWTYSFGAGGSDVYLVKTNSAGTMLWNKTYGGPSTDFGYSLVQTTDGGYAIAGQTLSFGTLGDVYLVKTDASGNMMWNKTCGGTGIDYGYSLVQSDEGGYAIAGCTDPFGDGRRDVYFVKTDAAGNTLWNKTYGGPFYEYGYSLVQSADGGYAIAGWTDSFGTGNGDVYLIKTDAELGLARTDQTVNTVTLYRGATDPYWNYVRARIWKID